ncbi:MAG: LysM peptidoglycan-binding domain-containing protein [Planctomycetes bacterium]|nr:LysM peptidoglycan-binding domain-containing protein [Planctomycetota bacterium]
MSTLEKLLVLGVLILVGVILAISLFWNRPEIQGAGGGGLAVNPAGVHNLTPGGNGAPGAGVLPSPPSMEAPKPNGGGSPLPGSLGSGTPGTANQPATTPPTVVLGGNPQGGAMNGAGANPSAVQPQAAPRSSASWLSVVVPATVLSKIRPSGSAEFSLYVVQPNDNPEVISRKLTGSPNYARMIDRANEGKKLISRSEILIPNVIFEDANSKGTLATLEAKPEASPASNAPIDANSVIVGPSTPDPKKTNPQPSKGTSGAVKAPEKSSAETVYVVKRGENLRLIAKRLLKDERRWQEIQQLNRLPSDVIREGQRLKLPAAK